MNKIRNVKGLCILKVQLQIDINIMNNKIHDMLCIQTLSFKQRQQIVDPLVKTWLSFYSTDFTCNFKSYLTLFFRVAGPNPTRLKYIEWQVRIQRG